ncbi:hypothetical protein AAHE18_20G091400 [Arachis hypogaea]
MDRKVEMSHQELRGVRVVETVINPNKQPTLVLLHHYVYPVLAGLSQHPLHIALSFRYVNRPYRRRLFLSSLNFFPPDKVQHRHHPRSLPFWHAPLKRLPESRHAILPLLPHIHPSQRHQERDSHSGSSAKTKRLGEGGTKLGPASQSDATSAL